MISVDEIGVYNSQMLQGKSDHRCQISLFLTSKTHYTYSIIVIVHHNITNIHIVQSRDYRRGEEDQDAATAAYEGVSVP